MAVTGELEDFDLPGILQLLRARRATGRLRLAADGDDVTLFLGEGAVVLVTSVRMPLRLGRVLLRRGEISSRQLRAALHEQSLEGHRRSLGEVLVGRGWVSEEQLVSCIHEQCVTVLVRVLTAAGGTFIWESGVAVSARVPLVPLDPERVLLDALRRVDELGHLRALVPPAWAPLAPSMRVGAAEAPLDRLEAQVMAALRGGASSWAEIAELVPIDEAALLKTLKGLLDRDLVAAGERAGVDGEAPGGPPPGESDLDRLLLTA